MTPFAYQFLAFNYDELETNLTLPSLRAVYEGVTQKYVASNEYLEITALYSDGTKHAVSLHSTDFKIENQLDEEALRIEAQDMIRKDAEAKTRFFKSVGGGFTGSPWLCDMGEDYVVKNLRRQRQWSWRAPDDIDWGELEAAINAAPRTEDKP